MTNQQDRLTVPVSDTDHSRGPSTAPVTLVEYGDFQCPFCKAAVPVIEALRETLGDSLRLVFRHMPLSRFHPFAEQAAEAAEAAGAQGKFWEMHDALFAHQDALDDASLSSYAAGLGLDTAKFGQALNEHTYRAHVRSDLTSALQSGARGTPTLFIDGVRHDGAVDLKEILGIVQKAHPELEALSAHGADMRVPGMTPHEPA